MISGWKGTEKEQPHLKYASNQKRNGSKITKIDRYVVGPRTREEESCAPSRTRRRHVRRCVFPTHPPAHISTVDGQTGRKRA